MCATQERIDRIWTNGGCHTMIEHGNQNVTNLVVGYDGVLLCENAKREWQAEICSRNKPSGDWEPNCNTDLVIISYSTKTKLCTLEATCKTGDMTLDGAQNTKTYPPTGTTCWTLDEYDYLKECESS